MKAFHADAIDQIMGRKPRVGHKEEKPKKGRKKKEKETKRLKPSYDAEPLLKLGFMRQKYKHDKTKPLTVLLGKLRSLQNLSTLFCQQLGI